MSRRISGYESMWKTIVRPDRWRYNWAELGPEEFLVKQKACVRTDIELVNNRGLTLQCSLYEPSEEI